MIGPSPFIAWVVGALAAAAGTGDAAVGSVPGCDLSTGYDNHKVDWGALARLAACGCDLDAVAADGSTLLMRSVQNGEHRLALWLLDHGANPNHRRRGDDRTILHLVADGDGAEYARLVDALVRHGADVNAVAEQGRTPLHLATSSVSCAGSPKCDCRDHDSMMTPPCWRGNPRMVRALLAHGADPNRTSIHGERPLFSVAENNLLDEVTSLIKAGARPTGKDENGDTIWDLMREPDPRVVGFLLSHGADANEPDGYGNRPLHVLGLQGIAWWAGRGPERNPLAIARQLLAKHANPNATNNEGKTPLHFAAASGFTKLARLLLGAGAKSDAPDKSGETPLHLAAGSGRADVVGLLLAHGARSGRKDEDGFTPLHWFARGILSESPEEDWARTARLLVGRGAKLDALDSFGRTPLAHAASYTQTHILLSQGASAVKVEPGGASLLHLAVYQDFDNLVRSLLKTGARTDAQTRDAKGRTPLHWAAFFGIVRAVEPLAESAGADLSATDSEGRTPVDWAIIACRREVANLLLRRGAPASATDWRRRLATCPVRPEPPAVDERLHRAAVAGRADMKDTPDGGPPVDGRDRQGRTPLHREAELLSRPIETVSRPTPIERLLARGAKIDARDRDGITALHVAAQASNLLAAKLLLGAGADVNATDDRGRTPLHMVSIKDQESFPLYQLLLEKGAKVGARDLTGRTPLHAACDRGHREHPVREVAELLICNGADPAATDAFGWTASDIARIHGWRDPRMPLCKATVKRAGSSDRTAPPAAPAKSP